MCPAGELLMDHGKILNDNSSNGAGTLHNGAGRNYYQDSLVEWSGALWWELHCVSLSSIVCLATQLFAGWPPAGYLHRPSVLRRATDIRPSAASRVSSCDGARRGPEKMLPRLRHGPPETGFPCVVLCSARAVWPQACGGKICLDCDTGVRGKICGEIRKYWRENI